MPNNTVYDVGQTLSLNGILVTVSYDGGITSQFIRQNNSATFNPAHNSTVTESTPQTVTITFQGMTASFPITINGIVSNAALLSKISEAQSILGGAAIGEGNGQYPQSAADALGTAIAAAQTAADNNTLNQSQIDAAATVLENAISAFQATLIAVDYSALNALISACVTLHGNAVEGDAEGEYAEGSKDIFLSAIQAAQDATGDTSATQAQIDTAAAALQNALIAFSASKNSVSFDVLNALIDQANVLINTAEVGNGNGEYPQSAVNALSNVITSVQALTSKADATQGEVNQGASDLLAAINTFTTSVISVDVTELLTLITTANGKISAAHIGDGNGQYPQSAVDALSGAITSAQTIANKSNRTAAEVADALQTLQEAIDEFDGSLVVISVDKSALTALIATANDKLDGATVGADPGQYPQSAYDAFSSAIAAAQDIADDADAAQSDADFAVTALTNAISAFDGAKIPEPSAVAYQAALASVMNNLRTIVPAPNFGVTGGEWTILSLARGGYASTAYYDGYYSRILAELAGKTEKLDPSKSTENARLIVALTAIGIDASDVGGLDLTAPFADTAWLGIQGINGPIWALISLDAKPYQTSGNLRQDLIDYILDNMTGSGWALSGTAPDVDMTAMALQALAPYKDQPQVSAAISQALAWLNTRTVGDVEGNAQVIVALSALGIDAQSYVEDLLTYYDAASGGFRREGIVNLMATEQAAYALVAYDRFINGENALYDMSDATKLVTDDVSPAVADKTELLDAIASAPVSKGNCTDASWNALVAALGRAMDVRDNEDAAQSEVDVAAFDLRTAISTLVANPGGGGGTPQPQQARARISVTDPNAKAGQTTTFFASQWIDISDNETAFSLLQKTGLDLRYSNHSVWAGVYVEAIKSPVSGLFFGEFDDGETSGWMYRVNGEFPDYSSSLFEIRDGDRVEWLYTRNLGDDIGGGQSTGGGNSGGWNVPGGNVGAPSGDDDDDADVSEAGETTGIGDPDTPLAQRVWLNQFADINPSAWYIEAVRYAYVNNLMNGVSDTVFAPDSKLTRAMLVTILARNAGFNTDGGDTWYTRAVVWGMDNDITDGTNMTGDVTREQFVTMLYRYANEILGMDTSSRADLSQYDDVGSVSQWAFDAMSWAVAEGLVRGRTETTLAPRGNTSRAEAAMLLMRFAEMTKNIALPV